MTTCRRLVPILLALTACGGGTSSGDDSALLGCRDFREVAKDYNDGALNHTELRARLQSVREHSEFAPANVNAAANKMVQAATALDDNALASAVTAMLAACDTAGQ